MVRAERAYTVVRAERANTVVRAERANTVVRAERAYTVVRAERAYKGRLGLYGWKSLREGFQLGSRVLSAVERFCRCFFCAAHVQQYRLADFLGCRGFRNARTLCKCRLAGVWWVGLQDQGHWFAGI